MITDKLIDNNWSNNQQVLLDRQRVNKLFTEAVKYPLVAVTAGAGYGKTRAVSMFLNKYGGAEKKLWMQFSNSDNMSARFWENFVKTTSELSPALAERLLELGFPKKSQLLKYRDIIDDYLEPGQKYVIVFDDCHLINNREVIDFMNYILSKPLENVNMILISRIEPKINVSPLLMNSTVAYVTEDDLRFTRIETAAFFASLDISLSSESLANIHADTKGWPLAVNLISISLRRSGVHEKYARSAMKLNVYKMMDNVIFSPAPVRLQKFLVRLSLIEHLAADLVRSLAGETDIISEMEDLSSFIRYDTYANAYRIHHLFLTFLQEKQDIIGEEEKREVWQTAAAWCVENDFIIDAISYYRKSGDYGNIVSLVYKNIPQQIPASTAKFLLKVFESAPGGAFDGVLTYNVIYIRILLSLGRIEDSIAKANEVIRQYSDEPETFESCRILSSAYAALGVAYLMMCTHTDEYVFDKYYEKQNYYYEKFPFDSTGTGTSQSIPIYAAAVGSVREGAIEELIGAIERSVPYSANVLNGNMSGLDMLAWGELHFYQADLRTAEVEIKRAFFTADEHRQYEIRNRALYYLLRIYLAQGRYDGTQFVIGQIEAQLDMKEYLARQISYDAVMALYYRLMGRHEFVAPWLNDDFDEDSMGQYHMEFSNLIKAWLFYTTKRYETLLDFAKNEKHLTRYLYGRIEIKVLEARCHYQLKDRTEAFKALEEAYELSKSNNLLMPFIEPGKGMRTLTAAAKKSGKCNIPAEWLDNINRRSATYAKHLNSVIASYRKENGLDDDIRLSPRERDVLTDMCRGLSRSEIAAQHKLSINTIKSVLNIVYLKLGARNNAEAIRIAVENKLIHSRDM